MQEGKAINFISQLPKTVHHRNDSGPHADQGQVSRAGFYPLGLLWHPTGAGICDTGAPGHPRSLEHDSPGYGAALARGLLTLPGEGAQLSKQFRGPGQVPHSSLQAEDSSTAFIKACRGRWTAGRVLDTAVVTHRHLQRDRPHLQAGCINLFPGVPPSFSQLRRAPREQPWHPSEVWLLLS